MRSPHISLGKLPRGARTGQRIRSILETFLDQHPEAMDKCCPQDGSKPTGFDLSHIDMLRRAILKALGHEYDQLPSKGISPDIIAAWCKSAGDPDGVLAEWLIKGAPLGVLHTVEPTGVFPLDPEQEASSDFIRNLATPAHGWQNYKSAEDDPTVVSNILEKMRNKKFCREYSDMPSLAAALGTDTRSITLNKLGLVSKQKPDGSWKHRIIWDLLRSRVNQAIRQGERIILPRLLDMVRDVMELKAILGAGGDNEFYGIDIEDAFHNVPVMEDEKRFMAASFEGKF